MFKSKFILSGLFFLMTSHVFAQTALVKGSLVNENTNEPASEIQVTIPEQKLLTTTDASGKYTFSKVPLGNYHIVINNYNIRRDTISITIDKEEIELATIKVHYNDAGTTMQSIEMPTIAMEENNSSDDGEGVASQNVSGLLTASRDPFLSAAAFIFSPYRFQPRGYERNQQEVQINGISMNDPETGDAYWAQWGGLNDVFRSRTTTYGLQPSEYAVGGLNGNIYFDATAASQRKQTRITYSLSNRNYRNRLMFTQSSGLMKNGWAYSVSLSKRWAKEGYIPGTFYDGYSYYAAVSKVYKKHEINFLTFGVPTRRGKSSPAIQESYDLAGTNFYNRNWGYQNGEKRNAREANIFQPSFILNHEFKPSDKTVWATSVGYQFGKNANSSFDWYKASSPWPDYYRNLPSYYINGYEPNPATAEAVKNQLISNPNSQQIDWDRLYNVNYMNTETITNVDGIAGNNVTGKRSLYVLCDDVDKISKWSFNTTASHILNEHININGGIVYTHQKTESYREIKDLLGGDFYVNYNQFAERQYVGNGTFNQNNLDQPNNIVRVGDKYGYSYINRFNKGWLWGQGRFTYNHFDFFITASAGINSFYREGLYKNGLFADASFGKANTQSFFTSSIKGGATYKINGRNFLFLNAGYITDAPTIDNTYVSPRTRNIAVTDATVQKSQTLEAGYLLKSPKLNGRLVGYVTDIKDVAEIKRFYNDDPQFQTFVNYVMQGVNMRSIGTEIALEAKLSPSFTVSGVAAIGQAFYTNRPKVSIYEDNDTTRAPISREVYMKNYYVAAGPQSAYTMGVNYRSKRYWYANVNFNYLDRNYVEVNPDRLTPQAADLLEPNSAQWNSVFEQEKLPSAFTVDLFAGKSILLSKVFKKLPRNTFIYLNVGVNNVFNNKNVITGGFQQLRYNFADKNPAIFPNKYFYGYGTNFFINISYKF